MPFDYTSAKIDWNAIPELVHPLGGKLPPERLDKKCQQLENLTAAVTAMARPGQVDFCSGGGHFLELRSAPAPTLKNGVPLPYHSF